MRTNVAPSATAPAKFGQGQAQACTQGVAQAAQAGKIGPGRVARVKHRGQAHEPLQVQMREDFTDIIGQSGQILSPQARFLRLGGQINFNEHGLTPVLLRQPPFQRFGQTAGI